MQITFPGFFLIPIGFSLFFISSRYLYYITVFFIPFSATSLLNSQSGAPLLAAQFFGTLFILREFLNICLKGGLKLPITLKEDKSFFLMLLFTVVVMVTMVMPLILDGRVWVSNMRIRNLEEIPLYLTSKNYKNPLPVVFGMLLAYLVAIRNTSPHLILRTARVYILSIAFVSFWGFLELFCFSSGLEFPYFIFNSSIHDSVQEIGTTISGGGFPRIVSVTLEPSLYAQVLLSAISICIASLVGNIPIFTRAIDMIMTIIIILGLLFSTSTTAYLGLLSVIAIFYIVGRIIGLFRFRRAIFAGLVISSVCYLFYNFVPAVNAYITEIIIEKQNTGSTLERLYSISTAWEYFLQYPILGLGWAMVTSHDLFVCLLANSGIIGLCSFLVLAAYVIIQSFSMMRLLRYRADKAARVLTIWSLGITVSFIGHLVISTITEFTYYLPHFYFLLGLIIGANIGLKKYLMHLGLTNTKCC